MLWRLSKDRGKDIRHEMKKLSTLKMYNKNLYKVIKPKLDNLKEFNFSKRPLVLMNTNKTDINL